VLLIVSPRIRLPKRTCWRTYRFFSLNTERKDSEWKTEFSIGLVKLTRGSASQMEREMSTFMILD